MSISRFLIISFFVSIAQPVLYAKISSHPQDECSRNCEEKHAHDQSAIRRCQKKECGTYQGRIEANAIQQEPTKADLG